MNGEIKIRKTVANKAMITVVSEDDDVEQVDVYKAIKSDTEPPMVRVAIK